MEKCLYKVELYLIKIIPMVVALLSLLNTVLSYFDIEVTFLSYIGSVSIVTIVLMYISSYTFQFCEYHRMFIHYIVVTWFINLYDYYFKIPLDDLGYLCLQLIVAGISLFIILYLHVKSNKRATIKDS